MEAEAVEEVQIMEELPHSLRREIAFNINRKIFQQLSVFYDFPAQELAAICGMMMPLQVTMATSAACPHMSVRCQCHLARSGAGRVPGREHNCEGADPCARAVLRP